MHFMSFVFVLMLTLFIWLVAGPHLHFSEFLLFDTRLVVPLTSAISKWNGSVGATSGLWRREYHFLSGSLRSREQWLILMLVSVSASTSEPPTANIKPTPVVATASKQPVNPGNKPTPRASIRPMITPAPVPTPTPTATVMPTTQVETQEGRFNGKALAELLASPWVGN